MNRIDLSKIERELANIASNTHKPFEGMEERKRQEENNKKQNKLIFWTQILAIATIILAIGTITLAGYTISMALSAKKGVELQESYYSPKITAQIISEGSKWSIYDDTPFTHYVRKANLNGSIYNIPLYIELNNNGITPFQVYSIFYETNCGEKEFGIIYLPEDIVKIIESGKSLRFNDNLKLEFNKTTEEELPCHINFRIYGNNLVIKRKMELNIS